MRRMSPRRSVSLTAVLLAVVVGSLALVGTPSAATAAAACSPAAPTTAARLADAVFTGVVGAGKADASAKPKRFTYAVSVQHSLKGSATGTVTVLTRGGRCGLGPLTTGTTYLFMVNAHGTGWLAPAQLGTTATSLATVVPQVQAALAPPKVTFGDPTAGAPASLRRIAAPGVALVLIGLLGLLFVRRRPRSQA